MSIVMYTASTKRLASLSVLNLLKNRDKTIHHIVVTPDRCAFNIEKMLFDILGEDSFFDVDVLTITRLCRQRLKEVSNKKILSKQSGVAIVKRLLIENKDKLVSFKNVSEYTGFASELFETIALYKSCNISFDDVFVNNDTTALNFKQQDIKLIYKLYEEYLKDTYTDSFNQLNLYAECIVKDTYPNTNFYFIESDDYTAQAYNIISKFAKFNSVYIGVPYADKSAPNKSIYTNKIYYDIIELSKLNNITCSVVEGVKYASEFKNFLSNNVLSLSGGIDKKSNANNYLKIYNYDTLEDEVKCTIQDIKYLVKTKDLSYDNFCIVVPSINGYKDLLEKYLVEYSVPHYLDVSNSMLEHYISRLLFRYLNIMLQDYSEEDVFEIISSPLFNVDKKCVFDYINHVNKFGLSYANLFKVSESFVNLQLSTILTKTYNDMSNYKNILTINEWIETINSSYKFLILDGLDSFQNSEYVLNNIELKNSTQQLVNKIDKIHLELSEVFGDFECDFKMFYEVYKSYFDSTAISVPPITSQTLFVADSSVSFLGDVDYVYILGANEGNFPMYQMDMGLLTDKDISKLPNAKKIEPTIKYINKRNKFNVFELMLISNVRTTVSYVNKSIDGSKLYRSSVLDSILSIVDESSLADINGSVKLDYVAQSYFTNNDKFLVYNNYNLDTIKYNFVSELKKWSSCYIDSHYRESLNVLYSVMQNYMNVDDFISNLKYSNVKDNLANADKLFFKNHSTSISEIETYYHCPYKHFITYGLKLKEKEWSEVRPVDNGNILHDFLYLLVKDIVNTDSLTKDELHKMCNRTITKVLHMDKYKFITQNPLNAVSIRSLKDEAFRVAEAIYDQSLVSSFKPKHFEMEFSDESAINIKVGSTTINLIGKIDRVDICDDGFRVIDYKTGDNSFSNYSDLVSGKKLQLIMYLKAFKDNSHLKPMGAFYFPISNDYLDKDTKVSKKYTLKGIIESNINNIVNMDSGLKMPNYTSNVINLKTKNDGSISNTPTYKKLCISSEEIDKVVDFAVNMCKKAISNILKGDISITPLNDSRLMCEFCEYKGICNYNKLYGNIPREKKTIETVADLEGVK